MGWDERWMCMLSIANRYKNLVSTVKRVVVGSSILIYRLLKLNLLKNI